MEASTKGENRATGTTSQRSRTSRGSRATNMSTLFLGYLLISVQLIMASSSAPESSHNGRSRWSPPARKARFFVAESNRAPASPGALFESRDDKNGTSNAYEDDKRLVRTGPNPLHN